MNSERPSTELEARAAEAVEFAGQVAQQLDECRERANAAEVEISRLASELATERKLAGELREQIRWLNRKLNAARGRDDD